MKSALMLLSMLLTGLIAVGGCASKSVAGESGATPAAKASADSARGEKFAAAVQTGASSLRPVPSTVNLSADMDAVRSGVAGSAIVAFVVLPNGRVDRDTRTLVFVEGHQIYAKNVCDALNSMRFEPPPSDARGAIGTFPAFFSIQGSASRDSARMAFSRTQGILGQRIRSMTPGEAKTWFAARPTCSALRIGVQPLYGPPPTP